MLKSRKELAVGKSMIKGEISMNFQGDKKEYQELAVSKEFQHMIANIKWTKLKLQSYRKNF